MKLSQDKQGLRSFLWQWVKYLILPIVVFWVTGYVWIKIDDDQRQRELEQITKETQESAIYQDSVERSVVYNPDTQIKVSKEDSAELRLEGMVKSIRR